MSDFWRNDLCGSSGGRGRGIETKDNRQRSRGNGRSSSGNDKINALGRLLYVVMLVFLLEFYSFTFLEWFFHIGVGSYDQL